MPSKPYEHTKSSGQSADTGFVDNGWLAALRGYLAGTAGLPGDIEGLARKGLNASFGLGGVKLDETPSLPTTDFYKEWLPGKQLGDEAVANLTSMLGGVGLQRPARMLAQLPNSVTRAAGDFALAAGNPSSKIFIGPKANLWDAAKAKLAEDMLAKGADPREVWKATGTLTSHPDKIWRQELSDRGVKFNTTNDLKQMVVDRGVERTALGEQIKESLAHEKVVPDMFPKQLVSARNQARAKVTDLKNLESDLNSVLPKAPLVIEHPELYNAYPDLGKIRVGQGVDYGPHALGEYSDASKSMGIYRAAINNDPKSTALHELQHAVQYQEGTSLGSSPMSFLRARDRVELKIEGLNDDLSKLAKKIKLADQTGDKAMVKEFQDQYNEILAKRSDFIDAAQLDPYEGYRRAGGEAESRATQARANMTDAERLNTYPFDSYDVPVENLILKPPGTPGSSFSTALPGTLDLEAIHYSPKQLANLDTSFFGTGLKGSSRDEYISAADKRLAKRAYLYADKGEGVRPEAGVGGIAHRAKLSNIYDADTDPLRLMVGDRLTNESAVLDRGFSGYLNRLEGSQPGQVVLLGPQSVPVEHLGPMGSTKAAVVPAVGKRPSMGRDVVIDVLTGNKALPAGALTPEGWAKVLDPDSLKALQDAGALSGTERMYKDELIRKLRAGTEAVDYSNVAQQVPESYNLSPTRVSTPPGDAFKGFQGELPYEDPESRYQKLKKLYAAFGSKDPTMYRGGMSPSTARLLHEKGMLNASPKELELLLDMTDSSGAIRPQVAPPVPAPPAPKPDYGKMSWDDFQKAVLSPEYAKGGMVTRVDIDQNPTQPFVRVPGFDGKITQSRPDPANFAGKMAEYGEIPHDIALAMAKTYAPKT